MRDRSTLRWLEGLLWILTAVAVVLLLDMMLPWRLDPLTFGYLRLSRTGTLTTARIESFEGYAHLRAVYTYATPDGVRHTGKAERMGGSPGDEILVFYLPGEPDTSSPRWQGFELLQLGIGVTLALACGVSLAVRVRRRLRA